jgi:Spy/CpxP family protein refolding chaperone
MRTVHLSLVTLLTLTLTLTLTTGVGLAGPFDDLPPGKWWENERLTARLALTAVQKSRIDALVYNHALRMVDHNAAVKRAEIELAALVERAPFDPAPVRAAFTAFQKARTQLENERFEMLLAVRQVLSVEQWGELQRLRRDAERRHADGPGARFGDRPGPHNGPPLGQPRLGDPPPEHPGGLGD